ncbi:DUF742 domain-containing protein [Sphaerimonospora sp. CA-214678]|uniref:DUF742 domain-containing protein n=1 Tax=Sphaerimonospora sp. CA-214678 TaxID=3240029 RepID=UPI003D90947E
MILPRRDSSLVRSYVVTGGRAHPSRNTLDHVSLVIAGHDLPLAGLGPESRRLMVLCRGGALSVAEVAAHLGLPTGVVKVLLADLLDSGHITARAPARVADRPSLELLQEVLDGLRALA